MSVINRRLRENPKAVVSLGCSFVQGQAAWDQEVLDILRPHGGGGVSDFNYSYKEHDLKDLLDFAEHFKLSMNFSKLLAIGAFKAFIHAILPDVYITSTTDIVEEIKVQLANAGCVKD